MKKQLRRLHLLFRFTKLTPEMFYSISVNEYAITLQGHFNSEIVLVIKKLFGNMNIGDNGFIGFSKNNIIITLT